MLLQGFRQDCSSSAPIPPLTQDKLTTPSICMPRDALSMQRLQGKKVRFVTGTDEHGEKIAEAAKARGMQPQEHCDSVVEEYKSLWTQLDISYDSFIRTTDKRHEALVEQLLQRVWDKGDIYKAKYKGWYCVGCEEYKQDDEIDAQHNCPVHRKPCVHREEENFFFRLSSYQQRLETLLKDNPQFVYPASRRNEVLGWVQGGVRDFSISRAATQWGIKFPQDPKQTVYVWFDALNGYLSGLLPEGVEPSADNLTQYGWPGNHIIGKDILRFHAVYWPGMLMSCGLPLPQRVWGHGFITKDGLKMGKSLGNVLDPVALVAAYGPDAVRFFFLKEVDFGQDGDFSEKRFRDIVNAALANDIGNLLNRTLNLLKKNCGSAMPADSSQVPDNSPVRHTAQQQVEFVAAQYEQLSFGKAIDAIQRVSARGNLYLQEREPWAAFKKGSPGEKEQAGLVLLEVLEAARVVAVMLTPIAPALARLVYRQLGFSDQEFETLTWADAQWGGLQKGQQTASPKPVFARLEGDYVTAQPDAALAETKT
ncbi:TPA: hypothetical protein ACH3X1_014878 [Trebouxia sp. C0004]